MDVKTKRFLFAAGMTGLSAGAIRIFMKEKERPVAIKNNNAAKEQDCTNPLIYTDVGKARELSRLAAKNPKQMSSDGCKTGSGQNPYGDFIIGAC